MCLGIPAQIVEPPVAGLARADVGGVRREISTALIEGELEPGDWVLIHVGFALNRIDEEQAQATLALLEELPSDVDVHLHHSGDEDGGAREVG